MSDNWHVGDGWIIRATVDKPIDGSPVETSEIPGTVFPPDSTREPIVVTLLPVEDQPGKYTNAHEPVLLDERNWWECVVDPGEAPYVGVEEGRIFANPVRRP